MGFFTGLELHPLGLSAGVLALLGFGSIALFAVLAYISLNRHLRRSRQPWPGEPGGPEMSDASHEPRTDRKTGR